MPFTEVILSEIELEKGSYTPIPVGTYIFQLMPGTKLQVSQKTGEESLNLGFSIAEGEYAGRKEWVNFPDPASITVHGKNAGKPKTWSAQALKKLQVSIGVDPYPGEDSVTYFNRVATSGNARVTGKIQPANYIKDGATEPENQLSLFSFGPSA